MCLSDIPPQFIYIATRRCMINRIEQYYFLKLYFLLPLISNILLLHSEAKTIHKIKKVLPAILAIVKL